MSGLDPTSANLSRPNLSGPDLSDVAASTAGLRVRRCGADDVIGLRRSVLRPHLSADEARYAADDGPGAVHFCAEDGTGRVVSVATLLREVPPWRADVPNGWRLRGMATASDWRGRGAGSVVLGAVFAHVRAEGGGLLWCNARLSAVKFYERAGMATTGAPWEEPVIGPHVAMFTIISCAPS
jgi:GNAT superfamily N-acetyltransferase